MSESRVLIIDHDAERAAAQMAVLQFIDFKAVHIESAAEIHLSEHRPQDWLAIILGNECDWNALERFVDWLKRDRYHPPVLVLNPYADRARDRLGLDESALLTLDTPVRYTQLNELLRRAGLLRMDRQAAVVRRPGPTGNSAAIRRVRQMIAQVAPFDSTVMITGESGTGKELVARALHVNSPRANKPFIAVNTAAIPKDLMESEFFGHERGAFTGAQMQRKGRFEQADGGSLFLDEIGDMPADLQTRLLRVLQNGEFYRVGGVSPVKVDVRVIAATHQDLELLVREGKFREDLFHRINVIRVRIPPLRERAEDIPLLMRHFLAQAGRELKTEPKRLLPEVMERLQDFDWPGNVRQLENTCRWLTVMAPGQDVHLEDLPPELRDARRIEPITTGYSAPIAQPISTGLPVAAPVATAAVAGGDNWQQRLREWAAIELKAGRSDLLGEATPAFERVMIEVALEACHGQRQEAARRLGWGRNTLTRKIKELGMED